MTTITRDQLLARVRRFADFPNANQGKLDTDLVDMINDALADYYDLLVAVRGHSYFESSATLSVVAGTSGYTLAADFYQMSTVTLEWGSTEFEAIHPINSNRELADYTTQQIAWERFTRKGYRLTGTQAGVKTLTLYPAPSSAVTLRYRYIPAFSPLTAGNGVGGVVEGENAWFKLVALDVAAEFRGLLGLPTDFITAKRDEQEQRVQEMATERLQDDPAEVVDTESTDLRWYPHPRWNSA